MKFNRHASQIILLVVNGLFLIAGGVGLVAGSLLNFDPRLARNLLSENHLNLKIANPSVGLVIAATSMLCIVISLVGGVGALCKLQTVLVLYSFILVIIIATQIAGAIFLSLSDGNSTSVYLDGDLRVLIKGYNETKDINSLVKSGVRMLFSVFQCCGVKGPGDFNTTSLLHWIPDPSLRPTNATPTFPLACCFNASVSRDDVTRRSQRDDVTSDGVRGNNSSNSSAVRAYSSCLGNVTEDSAFLRGCLPVIENLIRNYSDYIIICGIVGFVLEVWMIFLSARQCLQGKRKLIYEQISVAQTHFAILHSNQPSPSPSSRASRGPSSTLSAPLATTTTTTATAGGPPPSPTQGEDAASASSSAFSWSSTTMSSLASGSTAASSEAGMSLATAATAATAAAKFGGGAGIRGKPASPHSVVEPSKTLFRGFLFRGWRLRPGSGSSGSSS